MSRSCLREPSEKRFEEVVPEAWKATKSSESRRLNEVMNTGGLRRFLEYRDGQNPKAKNKCVVKQRDKGLLG